MGQILAGWRAAPTVVAGLIVLILLAFWPELRGVLGDIGAVTVPLAIGAVIVLAGTMPNQVAQPPRSKNDLPALFITDSEQRLIWASLPDIAHQLGRPFNPSPDDLSPPYEHSTLPDGRLLWCHSTTKPLAPVNNVDITENLPVALLYLSPSGIITHANAAARILLGNGNLVGTGLDGHAEGLGRSMRERIAEAAEGRAMRRSEMARCQRDGQDIYIQVSLTLEHEVGGGLIAVLSDKTELKTLEAQFVQSQKMQAVGQLAGGVAHDFNNLLTAISGHVDLLLLRHEGGDPDYGDLVQIRQNALRAAGLVKQLLAFSRKQTLQPKVLNLTNTLSELAHLLNRLLGEKVTLEIVYNDALWPVRVDERQMEQVIMNLVVNARDAMPSGGTVRIYSANETLGKPLCRDRAVVPNGSYVVLRVADTGCGIDTDKLDKIFEPFFTTKRVGEGTGLGLSTAYGIIKQTGGFIFADSTPGQGAVFTIYLPAHQGAETVAIPSEPAASSGSEIARGRILLVEDEAAVRAFAARALRLRGFDVDEADCGEAALQKLDQPGAAYDLFISDVIMPGVDGPGWVRGVQARFADTKVIFMSGYAEDIFNDGQPNVKGAVFLAKPFSLKDLTGLASRVLAG